MSWVSIVIATYKRVVIVLTTMIVNIVKGAIRCTGNVKRIGLRQIGREKIALLATASKMSVEKGTSDVESDKERTEGESSQQAGPSKFGDERKAETASSTDNDYDDVLLTGMGIARELIRDLQLNGPAGLVHLDALGSTIGRPIRVYDSTGRLKRVVGEDRRGEAIQIEYHEPRSSDCSPGHWTLLGNRDPLEIGDDNDTNNCLFNVVASQTGRAPADLRLSTLRNLQKGIKRLAGSTKQIVRLRERKKCALMFGGARYNGSSPRDAAVVIDHSQCGICHGFNVHGHPRGHASDPTATGENASVEIYSRSGRKTGFLSRYDQNLVGHRALIADDTRRALDRLNRGELHEVVQLRVEDLGGSLPLAQEFVRGQGVGRPQAIRQVTMVLRHHQNTQNDRQADVFIHTLYPRL